MSKAIKRNYNKQRRGFRIKRRLIEIWIKTNYGRGLTYSYHCYAINTKTK